MGTPRPNGFQSFMRFLSGPVVAAIGAGIFITIGLYVLITTLNPPTYNVVMTAGTANGASYIMAEKFLPDYAKKLHVNLSMMPTAGSEEGLDAVNDDNNPIQFALVQGGLSTEGRPNVREVAPTHVTVLHLLMKKTTYEDAQRFGLKSALVGKRISPSTPGSGTHTFAKNVIDKIGLKPGEWVEDGRSNGNLLDTKATLQGLPEAIFIISLLPSPVAQRLITDFDYRIYPLAFGDAYRLTDEKVYQAVIPAFAYSVDPPVPEKDTPTISRRLVLVANRNVADDAVIGVMAAMFETGFARVYNPPLEVGKQLDLTPEFPRHPGSDLYRNGKLPLTRDQIDALPKLLPVLGAAVPAIFFFRRTLYRVKNRKRVHKLRDYMVEATQIEATVRDWELGPSLSSDDLLRLRNRLSRLKSDALEKYAAGDLIGEELLPTFLAHITDIRNYLSAMIKDDDGEIRSPQGTGSFAAEDESWMLGSESEASASSATPAGFR